MRIRNRILLICILLLFACAPTKVKIYPKEAPEEKTLPVEPSPEKPSPEKKSPEKKISISEAIQVTPDKEKQRQQEIEEIYASAILRLKQIMDEIVLGRTKEWKEIVQIVENIVGEFIIKPEIFLSLVNNYSLRELSNNYALGEIVRDYLYPHSVNVSILAANLGFALGYNKSEVIDLCACSLIHDIGMLKISKQIIDKPSKLSEKSL